MKCHKSAELSEVKRTDTRNRLVDRGSIAQNTLPFAAIDYTVIDWKFGELNSKGHTS